VEVASSALSEAAASHELGRLVEPTAQPSVLAERGARLLRELGCDPGVVCAVRHMHERWDGTGGPSGLAVWEIPTASLILGVADALDHYASAWRQTGVALREAVDRAIGLVLAQQGTVFSPLLANAVKRERAFLRHVRASAGEPVVETVDAGERRAWLKAIGV
jgi:hypothetical protein